MIKTKNIFLLAFFLLFPISYYSQIEINSLRKSLDSLFSDEYFNKTTLAIDVYDLTENKQLYSKNEKLLLRPASLLKILTTSAALLFLEDYNFKTSLYYDGEIEDSVCSGNLYIVGRCDPSFTINNLDSLVREIKNFGIKEISGNLYADISMTDSLFWGEGWMWDDDPSPFAAYLSPLTINHNIIQVIYKPTEIGKPAQIEIIPKTKFIDLENTSVTVDCDSSNFIITRDWLNRKNKIYAKGYITINAAQDTTYFSVFNPAQYFLTLMKEKLDDYKINLHGKIEFKNLPEDVEEIISIEHNIDSIIVNTNKKSDNLAAEMILRALAYKYYGKPATAKNGIRLLDSLITLVGFDPKEYKIVDGSGLSFYNLISSELLTSVLKYFFFNEEELFVRLYNSFPISGFDGTLKNRMLYSNVYKKVRAKTGTLSGISNLAGYMTNYKNHLIAFSILIQNFTEHAKKARDLQDKICEIIYNN